MKPSLANTFFLDYRIGSLMASGSLKIEISLKNIVSTSSVTGSAFNFFIFLLFHCLRDCAAVIHFLRRLQKLVLYLKQLLLLTG